MYAIENFLTGNLLKQVHSYTGFEINLSDQPEGEVFLFPLREPLEQLIRAPLGQSVWFPCTGAVMMPNSTSPFRVVKHEEDL